MDNRTVIKIWELQQKMREDAQSKELLTKWESMNDGFLSVLNSLTEEQQIGTLEYVGYLIELYYKTVEYLIQ